ncbi:MAG TPA: enoyl-CoA hydratase/isomerase [Kofleriaceae bacterium]|nr:enoyl-CoA hydratase/isomerase [Kofleriaceae bacterium]
MSGYQTIKVRFQDDVCFIQIDRPTANNTINGDLVTECNQALLACEESAKIVVLSGSPEVFCLGADFSAAPAHDGPGPLYDLWLKLATGPFVTVAHVRGKANAGGVGFVAASDIVIADETAQFSLSELLFGFYPACVMPFLIRRIGFQKAHYLTLTTQPVTVSQAVDWGLVDAVGPQSDVLLRRHLLRLRRITKVAIRRYKHYMSTISQPNLADLKSLAVAANLEVFSDPDNLSALARYVESGQFPWEK